MNMQQKTYTATHRAKLKATGYARIEVRLPQEYVDAARELANRKGWPFWRVVAMALHGYIRADRAEQAARQRQANAPRVVGPIG